MAPSKIGREKRSLWNWIVLEKVSHFVAKGEKERNPLFLETCANFEVADPHPMDEFLTVAMCISYSTRLFRHPNTCVCM